MSPIIKDLPIPEVESQKLKTGHYPCYYLLQAAVMRPVNATRSMEMMFDLQRSKRRAGPFSSVRGRGLAPHLRGGTVDQPVYRMRSPAIRTP